MQKEIFKIDDKNIEVITKLDSRDVERNYNDINKTQDLSNSLKTAKEILEKTMILGMDDLKNE